MDKFIESIIEVTRYIEKLRYDIERLKISEDELSTENMKLRKKVKKLKSRITGNSIKNAVKFHAECKYYLRSGLEEPCKSCKDYSNFKKRGT